VKTLTATRRRQRVNPHAAGPLGGGRGAARLQRTVHPAAAGACAGEAGAQSELAVRPRADAENVRRAEALARLQLEGEAADAAWAMGRATPLEQSVAYAAEEGEDAQAALRAPAALRLL
jgi:hypothetical protein